MAKAAELDKGLVDGLKAAKSKRAYFALVLKGSNDGALILSKTKVPPAEIATAKKQCGGSAILKGFCQYEEGRYLFDTAKEAPATAAQAVKIIVKRDAGMTIIAEFRVSTDPELLADEGDAPAATSPAAQPKPDDGPAVIKRFHAMTADITAALGGPNNDRVKALFVAISGQIKTKDFAGATKNIDELAPLVKPAPVVAAPKDDGAAVIKRFHAMTADITAALGGPNNDRVKALFVAISGQIKTKDFASATKNIDELAPLVKPAPAAAAPKDDGAAVIKRFHALTSDIQAALGGPNNDRVKALFAAIRDQLQKKDFAAATKNIDELESLVKPAPAAAAPKDDGAAVIKRFHALTSDIQAALGGPNNDRVKALFAAIRDQLQKKDFAAATKNIDELESLVKPAPAAAPQDGAAVADRFKAMTPDIKTALAGPNQAQVKALFVAVSGQIKNKDFVQASKVLDELEAFLKPAAGPSTTDLAAEWKTKLAEWTPAIKAALTAKGPNAAAIGKLLTQASALSKPGGDMAQAIAKLTDCHALTIGAAEPAAAAQDAPESAAKAAPAAEPMAPDKLRSFVRAMTASRDWSEARKAAAADLNTLSSVILAEYEGDPRIGEVQQFLDKAAAGLNVLDDPKLDDLVLQLADSSDEKRPAIQSEAATIVKRLKGVLDQQNNLAALEDWPTMSLPLHSRLAKSLSTLEAQLAG